MCDEWVVGVDGWLYVVIKVKDNVVFIVVVVFFFGVLFFFLWIMLWDFRIRCVFYMFFF